MARPHAAAIFEDAWHRRLTDTLRERGWRTKIIPHTGYGGADFVRVLGRVLLSRNPERHAAGDAGASPRELKTAEDETRGWRAFVTSPAIGVPVFVRVGDQRVTTMTDRSGLVDVTVRGHGLDPGWHSVQLDSPDAVATEASVLVIGDTAFGVVSDIDDTVLSTSLPRPLIAGWNTFLRTEGTRRAVPGMATLYRSLAAQHPGAPFLYLSTGAWNTAPWLTRFLRRNGYPPGPMLLTDWGPTNTGWFRSGQDHKRSSLHRLARELPHVRWLLVGDDGQHDPRIYTEFAARRPDALRAIAIRELSTGEHVLSSGMPVGADQLAPVPTAELSVPVVRAPDGFALARALRPVLAG
ncbi:MAG TPA: phosphatase domain-containing protein [Dermatophilaceae bacterium]|nr:phosphatase domain-containing protein [Dermatophilaceae bacterium]